MKIRFYDQAAVEAEAEVLDTTPSPYERATRVAAMFAPRTAG